MHAKFKILNNYDNNNNKNINILIPRECKCLQQHLQCDVI